MTDSQLRRDARRLLSVPRDAGARLPPDGTPFRLAFVGQATYFEQCALADELAPVVETCFVDFRAGSDARAMRAAVDGFRPHGVIVFRPEVLPAGALSGVEAVRIGFLTEPIPRGERRAHPDLRRRLDDLRRLDRGNVDRVVSFDPLIADAAAGIAPVWRSLALPVADRYFRPTRRGLAHRQPLFVGRSTPHRESFLTPLKHRFDLLHIAHGADAAALERLNDEHDLAVNLHNEPYPTFENRVLLHLASAQILLSEQLSPSHGLEAQIDYVEVRSPSHLEHVVALALGDPSAFDDVRLRGRMKAESFRASRVYPRLLHDAILDLAAFGRSMR